MTATAMRRSAAAILWLGLTASAAKADDFYVYSGGLPVAPGTLLRSEPLPAEFGLQDADRQFRFLYTATDGANEQKIRLTSGAIFYPKGQKPAQGWPIIAWAHGTVGVADVCAPSRNRRTERDSNYLDAWLREGFVVVATDYEGLGAGGPHLYLHAKAEAFAILDSVRAALRGMPDVSNNVILLGQSQGGGAVFATAGYAPGYAPELNIRGTVATGVPYIGRKNPQMFPPDQVNPTLAYAMYVVRTAQVFNPDFREADVFTSRALPVFAESANLCIGPLEKAVVDAGLTTANSIAPGGMTKTWAQLGKSLAYPTLKLAQPLFIGTGEQDKDVSAEQQIALCNDARSAGSQVVQHVYPGLSHSGTVNASLVDSIPFVRRVLAGETVEPQCQTAAN